MPRYFLHIHDGFTAIDHEGIELSDLGAARTEAVFGLREMIAQEVKFGRIPKYEYIIIADEAGEQLDKIVFSDAIQIIEIRPSSKFQIPRN